MQSLKQRARRASAGGARVLNTQPSVPASGLLDSRLSRSMKRLGSTLGIGNNKVAGIPCPELAESTSVHFLTAQVVLASNRPLSTKVFFMVLSYLLTVLEILFCASVALRTMYGSCSTGTRDCRPGLWCPDIAWPPDLLREGGGCARV